MYLYAESPNSYSVFGLKKLAIWMPSSYSSDGEECAHRRAIERLASELGIDTLIVGPAWEENRQRLLCDARVKDYLLVLVWRATRDALTSDSLERYAAKSHERSHE